MSTDTVDTKNILTNVPICYNNSKDTIADKVDIEMTLKKNKIVKKKPGRPRKNPIREPRPRNGVATTSKNIDNFIEFLYDKPLIFKKIWCYFKSMAVKDIHVIFRPREIIIWNQDHHNKSRMRICINGNNVNHYFCKGELDIGMSCKNPELIMSTIDRTYNSILFLSKTDHVNKCIKVILTNDIEIDESHKIELIGNYKKMDNESLFLDTEYTLKFELPGRYFKKMISDIRSFSDQITIRQDGKNEPLLFEYIKHDKKISSCHIVRNNKLIKMVSNLKENETFRSSFKIDYVKPISSALLSETITIYAHENKPLKFVVNMDNNTVQLCILTDIIDDRSNV
jgi:hypothetical protein